MTKEELKTDESKYIIELVIKDKLKKEAEEWLCNNLHSASEEDFIKAMVDIAEPREKRIEELEAEVKEWKDKADLWCKTANLKDHNIMINKELETENAELQHKVDTLQGFLDRDVEFDNLQKENADLKCECRRCVYTDRLCILSDFGKDRNGICDHFKDVFDEVVELKDQLTKAKEIIKYLCGMVRELNKPNVQLTNVDYSLSEAEQFLSEVEK